LPFVASDISDILTYMKGHNLTLNVG
jgi:hypothetical protein